MKVLSPFPPFHDYPKYIPVKWTQRLSSLVPKTWSSCFLIRTYLALHIIPCLQFIIPSYYSFFSAMYYSFILFLPLQFAIHFGHGMGITFFQGGSLFSCTAEKVIHFYCSRTMGVTFLGITFFTTPGNILIRDFQSGENNKLYYTSSYLYLIQNLKKSTGFWATLLKPSCIIILF